MKDEPLMPSSNTGADSGLNTLVSDVTQLISLPDVYYRLESAIENPASNASDFSQLLGSDPDLCARLLRVANSAFYAFPTKIDSIQRAVTTIGLRQIRELVLVTSVMKLFNRISLGSLNMIRFWEHSVAVGVLATSIGRHTGMPKPERCYIPGLLHDIGRLVMFLKLPEVMHELLIQHRRNECSLNQLEEELMPYSHSEIGGRLLEQWNVPDSIYEPVLYHHHPLNSFEFAATTCAIHVADVWAHKNQLGSSGEDFISAVEPQALLLMGVEAEDVDQIWFDTEEEIRDTTSRFVMH